MSDLLKDRLPRYECHKEVNAGLITGMQFLNGRTELVLGEQNVTIEVDDEWFKLHPKTTIGGFYVVYDDGYCSYSPSEPFLKGYKRKPVNSIKILPVPRG